MTIFVAIPAYRDSELVPTVLQALAAASAPQDLRFGICWQRADGDSLGPLAGRPQVRIVERDYRDARGLGWARSLATTLYDGEDHFLQIDSHMRFVPGWDERMIAELGRAPSAKPFLSTWAAHYEPGESPVAGPPVRMRFEGWDDAGGLRFDCEPILDHQTRTEPLLTGFVCGHFLFAAGSFLAEVPNDPYIYFYGEEINTAVRAFTWGWDAYAPAQHLLWHHWGRTKSRIRHWEDHDNPADRHPWQLMEKQTRRRLRAFLQEPPIGRLGCGTVRSYDDYQALVGLDLRTRSVHRSAHDSGGVGLVSDGAGPLSGGAGPLSDGGGRVPLRGR